MLKITMNVQYERAYTNGQYVRTRTKTHKVTLHKGLVCSLVSDASKGYCLRKAQ